MKLIASLALKQSLHLNPNLSMAIAMLAMNDDEIEQLIDRELEANFCLIRTKSETYPNDRISFDIALDSVAQNNDFRDHLWHQVKLSRFNRIERDIAEVIINNLDDDGLFSDSEAVIQQIINEQQVFYEWVLLVRQKIMALEPISCAAFNINEALSYQITSFFKHKPNHLLDLLAKLRHNPQLRLTINDIRQACDNKEIHKLKLIHPRPAQAFKGLQVQNHIIIPDLTMHINNGNFSLSLTNNYSRILMVDNSYKNTLFKTRKKSANFFIKSLRFREHSLINVACAIINRQKGYFFNHQDLKPMILADIASDTGLHESSVSRLIRNKYLASKQGVHELKHFFSQAVNHQSSIAIKALIKNLLTHEDKKHPLSDQQIAETLAKANMPLARRTVAKYRESLGIAAANHRLSVLGST